MMKKMLFFALLLAAGAASGAGSLRLEEPILVGGTDEYLQYDDGSAFWLTWEGLCRGTWFDVTDFDPLSIHCWAEYSQYWFYHHATYSWDTASFYAELWNGDENGPVERLDQTSMTATHYSAVTCTYSPSIETESDFWALVNTSMSSGGWPPILADSTPNPTSHSFYSDDFILWEPWIVGGTTACDYFVRISGNLLPFALGSESWGAIKGLYR